MNESLSNNQFQKRESCCTYNHRGDRGERGRERMSKILNRIKSINFANHGRGSRNQRRGGCRQNEKPEVQNVRHCTYDCEYDPRQSEINHLSTVTKEKNGENLILNLSHL